MIKTLFYETGCDFPGAKTIREAVFCGEQGYPVALEYDEYDGVSLHLAVFDGERPVACGRLTELADKEFKLGRIAVLKEYRGKHLGALVMKELMSKARELGAKKMSLSAQTYAVPFYEKFGFHAYGDEYYDEHLPHIHMVNNQL